MISANRRSRVAICVRGRLGNQLFQISLGMHLESLGFEIVYDLSTSDTHKIEALNIFGLHEYMKSRIWTISKFLPAPFGKYSKLAKFIRFFFGYRNFYQDMTPWASIPNTIQGATGLDGYWQNLNFTFLLHSYLKASEDRSVKRDKNKNLTLGVHIRRGDFIYEGNQLPIEFFMDQIQKIQSNFEVRCTKIFSDDIEYCIQNLKFESEIIFSENKEVTDDFYDLSSCDLILMSRSTFSWWASYLSNAKVFYPAPWFKTFPNLESKIIPITWIPILTKSE